MSGPACQEKTGLLDTPTTCTLPRTLQWTSIGKKWQKKMTPQNAAVQLRFKQAHPKRESKKLGITGTGAEGKIQVITTKLVSVSAMRSAPSLEADTLCTYLIENLGNETVTCCKIESAHGRFGSFHITSECANIDVMYNPQLRPAGTYIRRYYEARGHKTTGGETLGCELKCLDGNANALDKSQTV